MQEKLITAWFFQRKPPIFADYCDHNNEPKTLAVDGVIVLV
jgi:hypothetical protein